MAGRKPAATMVASVRELDASLAAVVEGGGSSEVILPVSHAIPAGCEAVGCVRGFEIEEVGEESC